MAKCVKCPECGATNPVASDSGSKIDCSGCGMLLVLKKLEIVDAPAAAAPKAPAVRSRRRTTGSSSGEAEAAAPARRPTRGGGRRTTRGRSAPAPEAPAERVGGRAMRKNRQPVPAWLMGVSALGLLVIVGAAIFFLTRGGDEKTPETDDATKTVAEANAGGGGGGAGDQTTENGEAGDGAAEKPAAVVAEKPAETTKKPKKTAKPKWEFVAFERPADVTEEQATKAKELIEVLKDINATREANRAQDELRDMPRAAIPFLINALAELNPADRDDVLRGQKIVGALEMATLQSIDFNELGQWSLAMWRDEGTDKEKETDALWRRQAVQKLWKWWDPIQADWKPPVEDEEGF
ncbi:MAG: hypothetical protein R3F20_05690 [Planctomycetota bacterium]